MSGLSSVFGLGLMVGMSALATATCIPSNAPSSDGTHASAQLDPAQSLADASTASHVSSTMASASSPSPASSALSLPDASAAPTKAIEDPPIPPELLAPSLRGGTLRSPMPGGYLGGWYGDTGLDIAGRYLAVYAIAAGTLDYSESGHTLWTGKGDTPLSVRIKLDAPIAFKGHRITHVYYTHMSKLVTEQAEGSATRKHVVSGERIGDSGIGNGVPHLHLGLLLDDEVEQDSWDFILREGDIRGVMGSYRNGGLLPLPKKKAGALPGS